MRLIKKIATLGLVGVMAMGQCMSAFAAATASTTTAYGKMSGKTSTSYKYLPSRKMFVFSTTSEKAAPQIVCNFQCTRKGTGEMVGYQESYTQTNSKQAGYYWETHTKTQLKNAYVGYSSHEINSTKGNWVLYTCCELPAIK